MLVFFPETFSRTRLKTFMVNSKNPKQQWNWKWRETKIYHRRIENRTKLFTPFITGKHKIVITQIYNFSSILKRHLSRFFRKTKKKKSNCNNIKLFINIWLPKFNWIFNICTDLIYQNLSFLVISEKNKKLNYNK